MRLTSKNADEVIIRYDEWTKYVYQGRKQLKVPYTTFHIGEDVLTRIRSCEHPTSTYKAMVLSLLADNRYRLSHTIATWLFEYDARNMSMWREAYKNRQHLDEMIQLITIKYISKELFWSEHGSN